MEEENLRCNYGLDTAQEIRESSMHCSISFGRRFGSSIDISMAEETSRGGRRNCGYALGSGSGGGAGYGLNSGGECGICGESGHSLRDCKSGDSLFLQKGERVYKACYNCGSIDHLARECNRGRGGGGACYTCGGQGHLARECPSGGGGGRLGGGGGGK